MDTIKGVHRVLKKVLNIAGAGLYIAYGPLRLPGAMKLRSGADTAAAGKAIAKQRQHKKLQRSQANHANQQQADARAGRIARWVIANPGKTAADCPFARRGAPPER